MLACKVGQVAAYARRTEFYVMCVQSNLSKLYDGWPMPNSAYQLGITGYFSKANLVLFITPHNFRLRKVTTYFQTQITAYFSISSTLVRRASLN
jgi:hypothetical protein